MLRVSFLFASLLTFVSFSHANLMGVDLGLGYIKVAVARPGKGLELVTNEQSKRKTPSAVGFTHEGERLFGDAAVAYAAKAPSRAILGGRSLVGQCSSEHTSSNPEGTPFCSHDRLHLEGVGKFTGEEIVAMLLAMARRQASAALGGATIKDVAVTVPVWYDERQRQAISDAARIIGLNCLGVVNANTAAALKYALDGKGKPTEETIAAEKERDKKKRTPKTITQRVLIYDIGASSASASIAEVTSDVKTGIANSVKMLSHAWEKGIGGHLLDSVIVERLADAFDRQRGPGVTPSRDLPRVMMRLRKEAQRAREVLSANTDTFVSIASLHNDLDLRTTLSRAEFESDAKEMFDLVAGPLRAALSHAGLTSSDLHAIVPFGGTSRTPKVQEVIRETLGVEHLNKSINTDEAAVMGSAFFGASLSSTFRVRKLDFADIYSRSISADIEREGKSGGIFSGSSGPSSQTVELFVAGAAKMPSKKTLSLNRKNDFGIEVYLEMDKTGRARFPDRTLYTRVKVQGVSDVLKKLKDSSKSKTLIPRVALTFHVDRSGIIRIGTAESSVDETVVVEREVDIIEDKKNKTDASEEKEVGKDTKSADKSESSPEPPSESESRNEDQKSEEDHGKQASDKNDKTDGKNKKTKQKKKTKIEKSMQTVVHRHSLRIVHEENEGLLGMQMSGSDLEAAQKVLIDLESADKERVQRSDALNALEGFILEIRSLVRGLDEDDNLYKVSTEEERQALIQAFDEGEDWMYTMEAKKTANLRAKHGELQELYKPMAWRARELSNRPEVLKALAQALDVGMKETIKLRDVHLERKSKYVGEVEDFLAFCKTLKAWVAEMEEAQAKRPLTENPVITVMEVKGKVQELKERAQKIGRLETPPATSSSPDESAEQKGDREDDISNSTTTETSAGNEDVVDDRAEVPPDPKSETAKIKAASGATKDEL